MNHRTLIVLDVAGLSPALLESGGCPRLERFAAQCGLVTLEPVLPALTLSMQATLTTGALPSDHGIVGNGFFDRTHMEHRFWSPSAGLLDRPRIWDTDAKTRPRVAALFWWNFLGKGCDVYLNVAPFHLADGKTVPSCASQPAGLYAHLEEKLGPFPLHRFWGPGVSVESSRWILDATLETARLQSPDLLLSYLPQMDYSLQRSGPGSPEARAHLEQLDELLAPVLEQSLSGALDLVILSEYGIAPVTRPVALNRTLREAGLFSVRRLGRRTFPDPAGSRAFAICDHQIAHVYAADPVDRGPVRDLLAALPGVGAVLDEEGKRAAGIDHRRAGDLVALADEDAWFEYAWWRDEDEAPDYAFTVDIHRKIGYDPLELIADPAQKRIAADASLIRGSHGLVPRSGDYKPILATPLLRERYGGKPAAAPAEAVAGLLMNMLASRSGAK